MGEGWGKGYRGRAVTSRQDSKTRGTQGEVSSDGSVRLWGRSP